MGEIAREIESGWVTRVEMGSHDAEHRAKGEAVKVDVKHALFRVVKAVLVLVGYEEAAVGTWELVRDKVKRRFFLDQLLAYSPHLEDEKLAGIRLARAAAVVNGASVGQLQASPLIGTMLYEFIVACADLHRGRGSVSHKVEIPALPAGGAGTVACGVTGPDAAEPAVWKSRLGDPGAQLAAFPGLDARAVDRGAAAGTLELVVTWAVQPEPKPATPPPPPPAEESEEDSDEESDDAPKQKLTKKQQKEAAEAAARKKKEKEKEKAKKKGKKDESEDEDGGEDADAAHLLRPRRQPQWAPDLDCSCLLLDARGNLFDTVSFSRLASRNGAVRVTDFGRSRSTQVKFVTIKGKKVPVKPDENASQIPANTEVFTVDLSRVPPSVTTLAFSVHASVPGESLRNLTRLDAELRPRTAAGHAAPLARFTLADSQASGALVMALHRAPEDQEQWIARAILEPLAGAPTPSAARDAARAHLVDLAVGHAGDGSALARGGARAWSDADPWGLRPGEAAPLVQDEVSIGVSWTALSAPLPAGAAAIASLPGKKGPAADASAAAAAAAARRVGLSTSLCVMDGGNVTQTLSQDNPINEDQTVANTAGTPEAPQALTGGDLDRYGVALGSMAKDVSALVLSVTARALSEEDEQPVSLKDLASVTVRVVDNETGKELARYTMETAGLAADRAGALPVKIQRRRDAWEIVAIGLATEGGSPGDQSDELAQVGELAWSLPTVLAPGAQFSIPTDTVVLGVGAHSTLGGVTVDASVALYQEGRHTDLATKDKLKSNDKAIVHSGDSKEDREGSDEDEEPADEDAPPAHKDTDTINVNFLKLNEKVDAFVVSLAIREKERDFADLDDAYLRVLDEETKRELARFTVKPSHHLRAGGNILVRITREPGHWLLTALGAPYAADARTPEALAAAATDLLSPRWAPPIELARAEPFWPNRPKLGVRFSAASAARLDLGAEAWVFAAGSLSEQVGRRTKLSGDRAIEAAGDVDLTFTPGSFNPATDVILIALVVHEAQASFQDVDEITMTVLDRKDSKAIAAFHIPQADVKKSKAAVMAKFAQVKGQWVLSPIGDTFPASNPVDLELQLAQYL
jgi:stress response protein SCP2